MKTGKHYFVLTIVIGILCVPALSEVESVSPAQQVELPPKENEPLLLGQPEPALIGIRQLYIVIFPADAEPNRDGLVWKNLEAAVEDKISQAGIKIARPIQHEHTLRSLAIPELRINIDTLKIKELNQYVFHIETSLAKKVYLTKDASRYIKADLWKAEPTMRSALVQNMRAVVTDVVSEQVNAFIHACLAANPPGRRPANANEISEVVEEQLRPPAESTPAEYKYVASKNSNVFHRPGCEWAKKIKPENLIGYSSRAEAITSGKRPCNRCRP
jgi:hypothetical protein